MSSQISAASIKIFDQISIRIIKEQEMIIGPLAWDEARKVAGVNIVDQANGQVSLSGDAKNILDQLVAQYARLFGQASTEACKEAVQDLIVDLPQDQIPNSLR